MADNNKIKEKYDKDVYSLPVLDYDDLYDVKSGVYFLFSAKYGELLYVGKSNCVRKRINSHLRAFDDLISYTRGLDRFFLCYKVIKVPEQDLTSVETFFIQKYNPPMNYAHNGNSNRTTFREWVWNRIEEYDAMEKSRTAKKVI